ncbi:hypothetical protein V3C99_018237 [Haemonchus contortus]
MVKTSGAAELHQGSAEDEERGAGSWAMVKTSGAAELHQGSAEDEERRAGSWAMVKTSGRQSASSRQCRR